MKYRLDNLPAECEEFRKNYEESLAKMEKNQEPEKIAIESMQKKPI